MSGWPELAGSWHNQVEFLSSHGYRVAALDVRGYGGSSVPTEVERYTLKELTGDIAAVATALSDEPIVLVGHDWGAPIVWNTAIRHPDRVRAVAGLSVAHVPATGMSLIDVFDQVYAGRFFYSLYFIRPGEPEADFGADLRGALKRVYYALSGDAPLNCWLPDAPRDVAFLPLLPNPPDGPLSFITDADLDALTESLEHTGMIGAFNRYRALALDAAASADIIGTSVTEPRAHARSAIRCGRLSRHRRLCGPGRGVHRLSRQHDRAGCRALGTPREAGRDERGAARVSPVVGVTRPPSTPRVRLTPGRGHQDR